MRLIYLVVLRSHPALGVALMHAAVHILPVGRPVLGEGGGAPWGEGGGALEVEGGGHLVGVLHPLTAIEAWVSLVLL